MNNNSNNVYDITIIGAGPVGLFATFYAGMRSMKVKVIDALPELGGQLSALYPEKPIYDIPGFNKVRAKDLVERLEGQATKYNPTQCLNEKVLSLHRNEDGLIELKTNKKTHLSKTILICAGLGAFTPNKLEVTGVSEYEEKGIFYYIKNISDLSGKKVLVIGGGDSAVDWSLSLIEIAKKVILIHRRDKFTAHEDSVIKLLTSDVDVRVNHVLKEVRGSKTIKEAILLDNQKGKETKIEIDAILNPKGRLHLRLRIFLEYLFPFYHLL